MRLIDVTDPDGGEGGPDPGAQYGVVIGLFPSDSRYKVEIRRAEDLAGAPNVATMVTLDSEIRPSERVYVDFLAPGAGPFHYATRHLPGGAWTCWRGPASPVQLTGAETVQPVLPKPREALSQTAALGTLTLTVDDVQCRLTQVRMKSKAGTAAETAYAVVAIAGGVYTGTVALVAGIDSRITYELTFYNEAGALAVLERVVTFGGGDIPQLVAGDVTFDASGAPTLTLRGDALTTSIKYAVSTSGQPTATTVRAAAAVAGQSLTATPAVTVPIGDLFYVSAFAYSSAGAESAPMLAIAVRRPSNAPTDPQFLVSQAHAALTAERVVADSTTVAWDFSTPGVATASVPDAGITTAKLATALKTFTVLAHFYAAGDKVLWPKVPAPWTGGCRIVGARAAFLEGVTGDATFTIRSAPSVTGAFADMLGAGTKPDITGAQASADITDTSSWSDRDLAAGEALELGCATLSGADYACLQLTLQRL